MQPGDLVEYDFRDPAAAPRSPRADPSSVSVLQWNIERGYQLDKVIEMLEEHPADILCLQELDIECARSDNRHCAIEIARALKMKCIFVCEFIEIKSSVRRTRDQGGGYHGNAVLSRFDFTARVVPHLHQAFNWERDGMSKREPRVGSRYTLAAEVHVPGFHSRSATPSSSPDMEVDKILFYSAHLEVFCGLLARVAQISEILADATSNKSRFPCQVFCGDLNTMAHGIARFSPSYCNDGMRWRSLGTSEAEWLTDRVLTFMTTDAPFNTNLMSLSLPSEVVQHARNPGFYEPFDPSTDITLASYGGYYSGKLDWMLCMGLEATATAMGNDRYEASDHKWLRIVVREDRTEKTCRRWVQQWKRRRRRNNDKKAAAALGDAVDVTDEDYAGTHVPWHRRAWYEATRPESTKYWLLSATVVAVGVAAYWRKNLS
ncbi:hypothetical protein RI367_005037 [Sorochytrium milnesiophthora]